MNWENACNRDRQVSFQGRLDKILEKQKIRLRDNLIKITGTPEDVLVMYEKTTSDGDPVSTVIKENKVVNCIFPQLKRVPLRKVTTEFGEGYTLTNLVASMGEGSEKGQGAQQKELTTVEVEFPLDADINVGDKIVRVFVQENVRANTIMVFDVIDTFGDFSNNRALTMTAKLALSTKPVDVTKPIYKLISVMAERRAEVGY